MDDAVLRIAASQRDDTLSIEVYNDGPPLPHGFAVEGARGYGLKNVAERLRTRKPAGRVEIANSGGGVSVRLALPLWDHHAAW